MQLSATTTYYEFEGCHMKGNFLYVEIHTNEFVKDCDFVKLTSKIFFPCHEPQWYYNFIFYNNKN